MKKFLLLLPLLAVLLAYAGCETGVDSNATPVTAVIIKDGTGNVTSSTIISVTVGGVSKILEVSVTPPGAANAEGFTVNVSSTDAGNAYADISYDSTGKKITIAPVAETENDIIVTVKAKNDDNGTDWKEATFKVKVLDDGGNVTVPNAQKLTFNDWGDGPELDFNSSKAAPHDIQTFLNAKYLVITSVGGGRSKDYLGDDNYVTEYSANGFEEIQFFVDSANNDWADDYSRATLKYKVNDGEGGDWLIQFAHSQTETVYFIYDISAFSWSLDAITDTDSDIVFKFSWAPAAKILGEYAAYITDIDLTKNGTAMEDAWDGPDLGWITLNPAGLVLPE